MGLKSHASGARVDGNHCFIAEWQLQGRWHTPKARPMWCYVRRLRLPFGHRGNVSTRFLTWHLKWILTIAYEQGIKTGMIKVNKLCIVFFGRSVKALRAWRSI